MADSADVWDAFREVRRETNNERHKRCLLQLQDYPYKVNLRVLAPMHWRLTHHGLVVDFWPTSGRYIGIKGKALNGRANDLLDLLQRIEREATT